MADERVVYVGQLLSDLLVPSIEKRETQAESLIGNRASSSTIQRFLDDGTVGGIFARLDGSIQVSLEPTLNSGAPTVVLTRLVQGPIDASQLPNGLAVSTVSGRNALDNLEKSLRSVYRPLLNDDSSVRLLDQISAVIAQTRSSSTSSLDPNALPIHGIASVEDELSRWTALSERDVGDAAEVAAALAPLRTAVQRTSGPEAPTGEDILDVVDAADKVLQDVSEMQCSGRPAYDAAHLEHAMFLVASHVQACAQRAASSVDVFQGPFDQVHPVLQLCYSAFTHLEASFGGLSAFFASSVDHWPERSSKLAFVHRLKERAHSLLQLREVLQEVSMLTGTSVSPSDALAAFIPLRDACLAPPTTGKDPAWEAARQDFDARLEPYEERLRSQLRSLLGELYVPALAAGPADGRMLPEEVIREVSGLRHVLSRPGVLGALQGEVADLMSGLGNVLVGVQEEAHRRDKDAASHPIEALSALSQAMVRIQQIRSLARDMLPGEDATGAVADAARQLILQSDAALRDAKQRQGNVLDKWTADTEHRIEELKETGFRELMDFDGDGRLRTVFNQEMIRVLKQARQISALGLEVPKRVSQGLQRVRDVTRRGMALMQVVNFYNDVSSSIADCHKRMLLEQAKSFEAVILNPTDASGNPIKWDTTHALDGYLRRLSTAMSDFRARHERIKNLHRLLEGRVRALAEADLVKNRAVWSATVRRMQADLKSVEGEFDAKAQQPWRLHWDMQLKKTLALLYRRGLATYHQSLPPTEIRLLFQQRRLQFDPPLEQIRQDHIRALASFVELPATTGGLSAYAKEGTGFFASVAHGPEIAGLVGAVYEQAEAIFNELGKERTTLSDWVAVGMVPDVEAFVDEQCRDFADVKPNLQMVSQVQREVGKHLPATLEKGPYTVILAPVREAVERQCKQLQEAVTGSQSRQARQDMLEIESQLAKAKEVLSTEVTSIRDIGDVRKQMPALREAADAVAEMLARIRQRNRLIAEIAQSSGMRMEPIDTSALEAAAEEIEAMRQRREGDLEEKRKQIVGTLEARRRAFLDHVVALRETWRTERPQDGAQVDSSKVFAALEEVSQRAAALAEEAEGLQADCEAADVEGVDLEGIQALAAEVAEERADWERYAEFCRERDQLFRTPWMGVRERARNEIEDFLAKWRKTLQQRAGRFGPVERTIQGDLERYEVIMPHLQYIQGVSWEPQHWSRLFSMLGMPKQDLRSVTLLDFLERTGQLASCGDEIKAMDARAQAEYGLRKAMAELTEWGATRSFSLVDHEMPHQGKSLHLIKEWKDLLTEVGDLQALVGSLKQSPYFADSGIADSASGWDARLTELSGALLLLNDIQRRWVYLEPIFSRGALPSEQGRFGRVDREFQTLMTTISREPGVKAFADRPGLGGSLKNMATQLEHCQRALMEFLEERRSQFPRFYFIGDDDLLEVLSQSRNPQVIQTHLKKLFAGIFSVEIEDGAITHMCSSDGERVPLASPVRTGDQVEAWLSDLEQCMRATLQGLLSATTQEPGGRGLRAQLSGDDFQRCSSQVLCLSEMVRFTEKCEAALKTGRLKALEEEIRGFLAQYTAEDYAGQVVMQLKVKALVLDTIHHLDILTRLQEARADSPSHWEWDKQLRFYLRAGGLCDVFMASSKAMRLGYGGNPYGPAGTGKTESVKALGQYLGRQVLVFNCDEEFDFKSMGRIFMGLLKCGAWGCFDEFNRLEPEVLSAVSQQIQSIQEALKQGRPQMVFMGRDVPVNKNAGIYVTLNPAGKGYGGRSELPDNLKQLFRSVAMTVPDNELIAEVMLLAEGFRHARFLAKRVVTLFDVSRQLLSRQAHYDWGLRSLKTILGIAGGYLRDSRAPGETLDQQKEAAIVIQAVRMTKLPTLTTADSERFASLLRCQFGDAVGREVEDESLQGAIRATMKETGLVEDEAQVQKVVQLEMATRQRIGVIIVGPSGSGKSSLWQILEGAYRKLGRKLKTHKMNPKAIDRKQLLGSLDLDTREWTDGVLTAAARQVVKEDIDVRSWIICDGDVDPEWIESLNSVLDDNRLLTLPNGERIQLGAGNVNFIFECHSLQYASPATVSRCGMIFISEEARDIRKDLTKWVTGLEKEGADVTGLRQWADDLLPKIFREALTFDAAVETTAMGRLRSGLSHAADATSRAAFTRALATGFSANMLPPVRSRFLSAVGRAAGDPAAAKIAVPGTLAEAMGLEDAWEDASSGLIATAGVLETASVLGPWLSNGDPVIVAGPEGSGKASLLEKLVDMLPGRTQVAQIACSSSTGAAAVIAKLKQVCGKPKVRGSGKVLASPSGGRVVLLVRDVDLPRPDKYGTVQLVALLQQLVTYGGFYDESEGLEFVSLEGIQIACTMSPQGTVGRHRLSPRLTANVRVCYIDAPSRDELLEIFTRRMDAVVSHIQGLGGSSPAATALAEALVDSFDDARGAFSANDHRHYALTPRHLGEWTEGLLHYDMQDASSVPEAVLYEGCRVLQDRMVSESDGASMGSILGGKVRAALRGEAKGDAVFTLAGEPLTRGSVLVRMKLADYKEMVADRLRVFSREELEAPLVLFPAFLRRVAAVERALMRPGGALLLVGPSGAGRRSAALLAAHMMRMRVVSPRMVRGYGAKNFAADLKDALESAGTREEPTLLLVGDAQLVSDAFLEHINAWLSAGEIVGLLSKEDRERLVGPLEDHPQRAEFGTADALFLHRARSNLRVCVCMDPSSPDFARRCESNPALFGRCTVAWSSGWGDEGSQAVASHVLSESLPPKDLPVVVRSALSLCEGAEDARPPPRKLDALLRCFVGIMEQKRTETAEQLQHLRAGMEKLREASEMVDKLSREAEEQQTKLGAAQEEAEKALQKITATMESANARKAEVEKLSRKLAEDEVEIQRRKGGVEAELADVQPQIDAARAAVGSIKKEHLSEIKSMKAPPDAIRDVLEAVMKLMGIKDTTWSAMRNFLSQGGFKERIINFDARNIDDPTHADVSSLTAKRASSFDREKIAYVSRAAAPLAAWTMANLKYSRVLQQVAPLESMLSEITQQHAKAQKEKDAAQREIDKLESSIEGLKAEYAAKTGQAEQLKIGLKRAEETLQRATGLLGALVGERDRWEQQVGQLERDLDALPANALMAAAFCVFLPGEPEDVRSDRVSEWAPLVGLDGGWSFTRFMSSERQVLGWKAEGLPSDALSVENAVALLTGKQAPYVVDPSGSAAAWLEAHMKGAGHAVKITAPHAKNFSNALELAVRFGEALIVRDVDRIDPILVPLLRGDRYKQGPRSVVLVGDKLIDFEPRFRIFLVTRSPAPALTPQEEALVSVVNFSVTRAGLEAQLLGLTIQHEKPQLEKQLRELLREEEDMKVQLSDLEKSLLDTLAAAQGNILENEVLSRTLNETKHKAQVVEDALRDSAVAQEALAQERSVYAPVASLGSSVFFAIRDLRTVNHVYQISLPAFLSIFERVLEEDQTDAEAREARVASLQERLVRVAYHFVARGLFNDDRLTFAMHLARVLSRRQADAKAGAVLSRSLSLRGASTRLVQVDNEWDVFLERTPPPTGSPPQVPSWVPQEAHGAYQALADAVPTLVTTYRLSDPSLWAAWADHATPEEAWPDIGVRWSQHAFHQVLLVQALRPDRLQSAMARFASHVIGLASVEPPPTSIGELIRTETRAMEPVLFLTTPGADPTQELADLARDSVGPGSYEEVAMGQGQSDVAVRLLRECSSSGKWLCLKNLHLVVSWLPDLEKEIFSLEPHENFRLFLTSEAHGAFPSSLLEHSLKVTFEAPPGMRNNLLRTIRGWQSGAVANGPDPVKGRIRFALAWFHAILQERRRYVPIGWCKFYDFSGADLRSGVDIIDGLAAGAEVDWPQLLGLLATAVYGGKIDNDPDTRILVEYLHLMFNDGTVGLRGQAPRPLPGAPRLTVPSSGKPSDMAVAAEGLPESDAPELFSLPANVQRTAQMKRARHVVHQMRAMDTRKEASGAIDLDKWRHKLGVLIRAWDALTRADQALGGMLSGRQEAAAAADKLAPLQSMLVLEHTGAVALVKRIDSAMRALDGVLNKGQLITAEVQAVGSQLMMEEVPNAWDSLWEGPEEPLKYINSVARKASSVARLKQLALDGRLLGSGQLDLSGLLDPGAFLNALRQETATALQQPMDKLRLVSTWDAAKLGQAPCTVLLAGIRIAAASFDGKQLSEVASDAAMSTEIPEVTVAWVAEDSPMPYKAWLSVPVYASGARTRIITHLQLPVPDETAQREWILRGTALYLEE